MNFQRMFSSLRQALHEFKVGGDNFFDSFYFMEKVSDNDEKKNYLEKFDKGDI